MYFLCLKYGAVIGAFNCQGAGWDKELRRIKGYKQCYKTMEGLIRIKDIEWDQTLESIEMGYANEYVVYLNQVDSLMLVTLDSDPIHVVLIPSSFELLSFVPVKMLGQGVKFAPIGLSNMFNSGGTIQELEFGDLSAKMKIKGKGTLLAYSNEAPKKCIVNNEEVEFQWSNDENKLVTYLPWIEELGGVSEVIVQY